MPILSKGDDAALDPFLSAVALGPPPPRARRPEDDARAARPDANDRQVRRVDGPATNAFLWHRGGQDLTLYANDFRKILQDYL